MNAALTLMTALVLAATVPAVAFPLLYAWRSPWRATRPGRALMLLSIALAVTLGLNTLAIFLHDYPGRGVVQLMVYLALVYALWRQLLTLVAVQNGYSKLLHRLETGENVAGELPDPRPGADGAPERARR